MNSGADFDDINHTLESSGGRQSSQFAMAASELAVLESQPSLQHRDSCGVGTIAGTQLLDGGRKMIPDRTLGQV